MQSISKQFKKKQKQYSFVRGRSGPDERGVTPRSILPGKAPVWSIILRWTLVTSCQLLGWNQVWLTVQQMVTAQTETLDVMC